MNLLSACRGMTCAAFAAALLAGVAYADQPPVIPRIGVLMPPVTSMEAGLREGLCELSHIEGKSMVIEWRRSRAEPEAGDAPGGVYVDNILHGALPSDLPIEQVSRLELVIDLRVARAQGLEIPQELLLRADEVIR